ncbi:hypothetical protein MUO14_05405 [Halobacillus shinanisalinarum]|uniref:Uncharacterized protein n=1 Tax=Halobacillus shinanisalinarum TaxID=2932258 RepID=A0ABY4H1S8_9BACI|nr:hypothetical protein [Halobacillus shinanisalinarum]UOQ94393.1 hypothetical protein MUO14_05405 [Halobacillus shinanisalinarum]
MKTEFLDLENARRLEETVKDGVYVRPNTPSKVRDSITKKKIEALKKRKAKTQETLDKGTRKSST